MKYHIDFQFRPSEASRPLDNGTAVDLQIGRVGGDPSVLPNVGDFVDIQQAESGNESNSFRGVVVSRLFNYVVSERVRVCTVNIVVQASDHDWGKLLKC